MNGSWKRRFLWTGIWICLLAGCVRPATVSTWTPQEVSSATKTETPPATLGSTQPVSAGDTVTPAVTSTPFVLPDALPHSMKGYELYCWQKDSDWYFTLFTGTNRSKSFDEIIAPENQVDPSGLIKITVSGVDKINEVIALLPAGEEIIWGGMDLTGQVPSGTVYLTFPPQPMMDEIQNTCLEYHLKLEILKE